MAEKKNPQILENYEIGELIGKGRFAEVFRAVKRDLGREVALKILLPAWNENAAVRSQFMEQAKIVARLKHPRIVEALDLGEENGRLFMAMEYLPKGDLHEWLQSFGKKRPSLLQVVILVEDIARALDYIHNQNASGGILVHGDVKPGNILLTEERDTPGRLRAKLSDLGLLTVLQKAASMSGSSAFPQSSPLYISPEQADDNSPTPYSDQYALGVVTYELLTGQPPFVGGSDVTIYRHHKQTQPQPPSAHVSQLQREIDEVLLKVLAKDPTMRYPNCASFARALRQAVEVAEQKRFADLLTQARGALAEGQPEKALPSLEEASQIKPDDSEVRNLFEQAQKTALAARNYQEAGDLLETARTEAQKLRAEAPDYSDAQKLLTTFAPRPPVWWEVLLNQWKRALGVIAILFVLALFGSIFYAANNTTKDSGFQKLVSPFWTPSPTITLTPTNTSTLTVTPTFTPTFTPSPRPIAIDSVADIILLQRLPGLENAGAIYDVEFSPNGDLLAAGSADGMIRIWQVGTWDLLHTIDVGNTVSCIAFSHSGDLLAAGTTSGYIKLWATNGIEPFAQSIDISNSRVNGIVFSPDDETIASAANDGTVRVWDRKLLQRNIGTGEIGVVIRYGFLALNVAFSPDGESLSASFADDTIRFWNTSTYEQAAAISADTGEWTWGLAFSPNEKFLASSSSDGLVRIIDVSNLQETFRLSGHKDWVRSIAFSPSSEIVASASDDKTVILWDTASYKQIILLTGHSDYVYSVAFSPNELWLVSSSVNEVFLWTVPRWDTPGTPTLVPTRTTTPTPTSTP